MFNRTMHPLKNEQKRRRCSLRARLVTSLFASLVVVISSSTPAFAEQPLDLSVGLYGLYRGESRQVKTPKGPAKLRLDSFGPGLQISAALPFNDFFALTLNLASDVSFHEAYTPLLSVSRLDLGVRYTIDVFTWVPYIEAGLGAALLVDQDRLNPHMSAYAGLGLNYRLRREDSIGGFAYFRTFLAPQPLNVTEVVVGFSYTRHFSLGR